MLRKGVLADGPEIKRRREAKGWSLRQLGETVEVRHETIFYIENGRRCSLALLGRIALALGVPARDITAPGDQDRISA